MVSRWDNTLEQGCYGRALLCYTSFFTPGKNYSSSETAQHLLSPMFRRKCIILVANRLRVVTHMIPFPSCYPKSKELGRFGKLCLFRSIILVSSPVFATRIKSFRSSSRCQGMKKQNTRSSGRNSARIRARWILELGSCGSPWLVNPIFLPDLLKITFHSLIRR